MTYTFQFGQLLPYVGQLIDGVWLTVILGVQTMVFSLIVGTSGALARTAGPRVLRSLVAVYVEVIRNTPVLVQVFLIFFALPGLGLRLSPNTAAVVALTINGGAYLTEIIRAGILAIPRGQIEAGRALGLNPRQIFFDIVAKPAIKTVYPAVTSEFVILLLNTSICSQIAANELTAVGNAIDSQTFRSLEVYVVLCVIYVGLSFLFSSVFKLGDRFILNWRI